MHTERQYYGRNKRRTGRWHTSSEIFPNGDPSSKLFALEVSLLCRSIRNLLDRLPRMVVQVSGLDPEALDKRIKSTAISLRVLAHPGDEISFLNEHI